MNRFGKYEYILQSDNLILTERIHLSRLYGYLMLIGGGLATYMLTFEPHSIARKATDPATVKLLFGFKWFQAIFFLTTGIYAAFVRPAPKVTLHLSNDNLKIGNSNPIPLKDLTIETSRDLLSRTLTFKNKGDACWSISTNRQQELQPLLEQLRLLGLEVDQT